MGEFTAKEKSSKKPVEVKQILQIVEQGIRRSVLEKAELTDTEHAVADKSADLLKTEWFSQLQYENIYRESIINSSKDTSFQRFEGLNNIKYLEYENNKATSARFEKANREVLQGIIIKEDEARNRALGEMAKIAKKLPDILKN